MWLYFNRGCRHLLMGELIEWDKTNRILKYIVHGKELTTKYPKGNERNYIIKEIQD